MTLCDQKTIFHKFVKGSNTCSFFVLLHSCEDELLIIPLYYTSYKISHILEKHEQHFCPAFFHIPVLVKFQRGKTTPTIIFSFSELSLNKGFNHTGKLLQPHSSDPNTYTKPAWTKHVTLQNEGITPISLVRVALQQFSVEQILSP